MEAHGPSIGASGALTSVAGRARKLDEGAEKKKPRRGEVLQNWFLIVVLTITPSWLYCSS